jgi:hypothetical protein
MLLHVKRRHTAAAAFAACALLLLDLLQLLQAACTPGPRRHTACLAALAAAMRCCCCGGCKPDMLVVKPLVEPLLQDCMRLRQRLMAQRARRGVSCSSKATLARAPAASTAATRCCP